MIIDANEIICAKSVLSLLYVCLKYIVWRYQTSNQNP